MKALKKNGLRNKKNLNPKNNFIKVNDIWNELQRSFIISTYNQKKIL